MKASLKQLVNSKEYKVIRNSKFTAQNKANLKNYATEKGMLSVVSLLNKDSLPQYRQTNAKVVKRYIIYFNKYKKGDYTALGNATKLMSFYFANLIGNSYLITDRKKNYEAENLFFSKFTESSIQLLKAEQEDDNLERTFYMQIEMLKDENLQLKQELIHKGEQLRKLHKHLHEETIT